MTRAAGFQRRALLLLLAVAACSTLPPAPDRWAPAVEELRAFVRAELEARALPTASVAVLVDDQLVWSEGFGASASEAARGDSVYRVASISKLFTAVAALRLAERGVLDLDRPVGDAVPGWAPPRRFETEPTLRHLLTHHAGIEREPGAGHYFEPGSSLAALVDSVRERPGVYPPGARGKYSNTGPSVVGYAVESAGKAPFAAWMERELLAPLGLRASSFDPSSAVAARALRGTMWTLDGRQFPAPDFPLGMVPAAGLYTTVEDLVRFAHALFEGGSGPAALGDQGRRQLYSAPFGGGWGHGCFLEGEGEALEVAHGGALYGTASELRFRPRQRLAVAVATSLDCANGAAERIARRALAVFAAVRASQPIPPRPDEGLAPTADELAAWCGRYKAEDRWLEIEARDGALVGVPSSGFPEWYRVRGDGSLGVVDRFCAALDEHRLERTPDGLRRDGVAYGRLDDRPPPPPDDWRPLIGEYGSDHDVLYVLEDRGRLCCLIEWFVRYPLVPRAPPDGWAMPDHGMYAGEAVEFERGGDGRVAAVRVGAVRFPRRAVGPEDGAVFRIEPRFPRERLLQMAREARMPAREPGLREPELVAVTGVAPSIRLDVRYATANNFVGTPFYDRAVALLQRPAAEALGRVQRALEARGLGLLVHDAYRPWQVTKMFWDATRADLRHFVADPARGSRHNRGCAVDLTLCRADDGVPLPMVSGYDEFTPRAHPHYPGGTAEQRWARELLRREMGREGFTVYEWEWWHFDHRDWRSYPVLDAPLRDPGPGAPQEPAGSGGTGRR